MGYGRFNLVERNCVLLGTVLCALLSHEVAAKTTGFTDNQKGLSLGIGTYTHPLANDNNYDPVPSLAPTGTTTSDSEKIKLLPAKLGIFMTRGSAEAEGYFRYMLNTRHKWTATGGVDGDGYVTFRSYGAGLNLGVALAQSSRAQIKLALNGEYVLQRANLSFDNSGSAELLKLKSTSLLAGVGLQPELWLGDLWVLSLFAGYQYGFLKNWEVAKAGNFMGRSHTEGALYDANGNAAHSQFGGVLLEVSFKLNFYE